MPQGLVGITLKSLRKERKLTLKELAAQTEVSVFYHKLNEVNRASH